MDRGAWQATVHRVTERSDTTEQLKDTTVVACTSQAYKYLKKISQKAFGSVHGQRSPVDRGQSIALQRLTGLNTHAQSLQGINF